MVLTPVYRNERRAKGLCCFCDERFTYEHSLTHKKGQVENEEEDVGTMQTETLVKESLYVGE